MPIIFLAIPYAVAVRDVLRSETLDVLTDRKDLQIVILVPAGELSRISTEFSRPTVRFEPLHPFSVNLVERILHHFNRGFLYHKCRTIQLGNVGGMTWTLRAAVPFAQAARFLFGERSVSRAIAWCFRHLTPREQYADLFDRYRPDLVVVSRVLNFSMDYPVMKRAQVEGIPVVVLVSSWDNFTSKGFFAFDVDRLVVWNEVMKEEAVDLFFYDPEKVLISGIPRYDVFFAKERVREKGVFFDEIGLDPCKKLITYATGSNTTGLSPYDSNTPEPEIAEYIADAIADGRIPGAHLLVRLHPQAAPAQYERIQARQDVTVQIPGQKSSFVDRLFTKDDDQVFAELMIHSDVVVNLFSTVTLDSVACNTPVICVNFDIRGPRPLLHSVKRYGQFDHNAKLAATGCVRLADSPEILLGMIVRYLEDPSLDAEARQRAIERYCVFTDGASGVRVGKFILEILDEACGRKRWKSA
jgi:hypothetical protein